MSPARPPEGARHRSAQRGGDSSSAARPPEGARHRSAQREVLPAGGDLRHRLEQGAQALGVSLSTAQVDQLLAFLDLLGKWSRVYNLTALRSVDEGLTLHLLDSLALLAPLRQHLAGWPPSGEGPVRVLDVGSGAGLPAVVLAIACPDMRVTSVDAVAKKAAFVTQVAAQLHLPNLHARHDRVQAVTEPHQLIVSRAFASLADFTAWSRQALADGGVWVAMKGRRPDDEIAALPPDCHVFHVEPLIVPGLDAERCLVWIRPAPTA